MSAFLVSMLTINQIVATLSSLLRSGEYPAVIEQLAIAGIDTAQRGWEERLATAMFVLNQEALHQRYGDPARDSFIYRRVLPLANLYQLLKSVHCWRYQCTEGTVPNSKLYRLFATVIRVCLLEMIVYRLPEYEAAEWR